MIRQMKLSFDRSVSRFIAQRISYNLFRGHLLANMADLLQSQLAIALPLFLDRLRNEITRLTTVKALSVIAK